MDVPQRTQVPDLAISDVRQRPLRVDPNRPLPTSIPPIRGMEQSHLPDGAPSNGLARATSRKRRPSGAGRDQYESFPRPGPEAPEVPKAPPVSYREPYHPNSLNGASSYGDPTSFAARARAPPGDGVPYPESPVEGSFDTMTQTTRHNRRGSARRSMGSKPVEGYASPSEPNSPTVHQPLPPQAGQATETAILSRNDPHEKGNGDAGTNKTHVDGSLSRSNTRRVSASGVDPRKEWAKDRSPLQRLEGKLIDISKEEKRARVEEAEQLLRERRYSSARDKQRAEGNVNTDRTISGQPPAEDTRRSSNRQSSEPISQEGTPRLRETNVTTYDPRQGDVAEASPLAQPTRKPREPSTRGPARFSDYSEPRLRGDRSQSQRSAQLDQQDATARKEDVRSVPPKRSGPSDRPSKQVPKQQQGLYSHRAQSSVDEDSADDYGGSRDPVPRRAVESADPNLSYEIPPQTASGIAARHKVGFEGDTERVDQTPVQRGHRLSKLLHRGHRAGPTATDEHMQQSKYLDDWRKTPTARLTAADFAAVPKSITNAPNKYNAWWDKEKSSRRSIANAGNGDFVNDENLQNAHFEPPLHLKCGPLLRFTGLQRSRMQQPQAQGGTAATDREVWRGSIMIVTTDSQSDYSSAPTLELFPEPMDMLPPPPPQANIESSNDLPTAYMDPVAGLPKLTREGGVVFVRPAEDLDHEKDLSRAESDDGLFEKMRTANVPSSYGKPKFVPAANAQSPAGRGYYRRTSTQKPVGCKVKGGRLHAERGVTFWRFSIEVELTEKQQRIGYRINNSASVGFWVPAKGQTMNMMFHSCNGFSMSVDSNAFSGPDPLWRDVLNNHQSRPFHVMIGGGDQIYNDRVMTETELFQDWLTIKNPHHKHHAPFSSEMLDELETFYLERYSMWFSQGLFGMANSQIPMVNIWDDHDIIDGFGSYPHHFMSTPVFCGVGNVAFKYYMLFQHQSVADEGPADEPSWLMGASPGPYISELSRNLFMHMGKNVAFLGLDCRTERMRDLVVSEATYDLVFDRCRREIIEGETKHLIVLLGVPIAYPRLNFLENVLTSRLMDPIKALGRAGLLGGFINKFDGGVEILDDLDDHWTAKHHKEERQWFIQELQELAADKSVRVTILGGDVHLAAIGQFYSNPQLNVQKDRDHRYIPNVISSAIVNTPPPEMMADIMNKRNKKHYLDREDKQTLEDMIPMFTHDVDGKARNNKHLLPRRNWCSIREYHPGSTPAPTPPDSEHSSMTENSLPQPPPTRLQRTLSLGRGDVKPGNLIRRLSGRARPQSPDYPISNQYQPSPRAPVSPPQHDEDYFTPHAKRASTVPTPHPNGFFEHRSAPLPRPGNFHRRPTNMSEKAVLKGGADTAHADDEEEGHINLEHGLDICINCEVNQKDPAGITVPYRLLVPALWYEGPEDVNSAPVRKKSVIERFKSIRLGGNRKSGLARRQGQGEWGGTDSNYTPSISEAGEHQMSPPQQAQPRPVISNPMPLQDKGYPGRRLSKADRMLGTTADDYHPPSNRENDNGEGAPAKRVSTVDRLFYGAKDPPPPNNGKDGHGGGKRVSTTERLFGRRGSSHDQHVAPPPPHQGEELEPFPQRPHSPPVSSPPRNTNTASSNNKDINNNNNNNNNNVVLGAGFKTSSAGSRATGPQGLPTGNGTVKTETPHRTGSIMRSGSNGYQPPDGGNDGVVLGRGEKVSSGGAATAAGKREVRYAQDEGYGYGYGGEAEAEYSDRSWSGSGSDEAFEDSGREQRAAASRTGQKGKGKNGGYGGIDAYKEKGWRRFFTP
ncbi:MAG: hypothetical protein Q9207_003535 [Kuettlingeria erythrocarpa]